MSPEYRRHLMWVLLFAIAVGYFEAAVVAYMRHMFYPEGFSFPLRIIPLNFYLIELGREAASILILAAVGIVAGKSRWDRFGWFIIVFGVWDITYYAWLKLMIGWPSSLVEPDVLFLIPIPWIGPVIAPILVAMIMILCGAVITHRFSIGRQFAATNLSWTLSSIGVLIILFSFLRDVGASLRPGLPQPYGYPLLFIGLALWVVAFAHAYRHSEAKSLIPHISPHRVSRPL